MPLHDRFLRVTPYERIFPDRDTRDRVLDAIEAEVRERGMGDGDPGAFALLARTREALAELRDPGGEDDGGHTHAVLVFHAYHLRRAGEPHLLCPVPVSRWAVEGDGGSAPSPAGEARASQRGGREPEAQEGAREPEAGGPRESDPGDAPAGLPDAVYVQLPQHLFWVRESARERPRSLDGFFWTVTGESLHLLGVVDLQPGGPGLRVLPLPAVPRAERELWLSEPMREDGSEDFRSEIPGSEMEALYELRTAGELLKLAARLDRFLERFPGASVPGEGAGAGADGPGPVPGAPAYRRLELS